jgi:hypothetical protein
MLGDQKTHPRVGSRHRLWHHQLAAHRLERLHALLDLISPPQKRVSVKKWHQLLGELRSMSPALPGSRGLFLDSTSRSQ